VVAAVFLGLAGAPQVDAARLTAAAGFHVPGRVIECVIPVQHEGPPRPPLLSCWRARDGMTFDMRSNGRTSRRLYRPHRGYHDWWAGRLRVPYGQEWSYHFDPRGIGRLYFTCASTRKGLFCKNRVGHGWFIGRETGSRIF
jgi:hypothetical protein